MKKAIFIILLLSVAVLGQNKIQADSIKYGTEKVRDVESNYTLTSNALHYSLNNLWWYVQDYLDNYLLFKTEITKDTGYVIGYLNPGNTDKAYPVSAHIDEFLNNFSISFNALKNEVALLRDSLNALSAYVYGSGGVPTYTPVYTLNYSPTQQFYNTTTDSARVVYIKNTGTGQLLVTNISYEIINTGRTLPFSHYLSNRTTGLSQDTIWSGDSLKLTITYTPYDVGNEDGWRMLISSNGGAQDTVDLYGSGAETSIPNILYVSISGNDAYPGTIELPIRTVARANAIMDTTSVFDSCLFKGGESFYGAEIVAKSNKVYGSYGVGNATINYSPRTIYIRAKDNVVVRNLDIYGNILVRDVDSCVLKDLNVYGVYGSRDNIGGIQIQGLLEDVVRVERCTVKNFAEGIRVYAMAQSDLTNLDSLIIDNCRIDSCYRDDDNYDGIRLIGNENVASIDFSYKAIVRNCEVTNWGEDAIDIAFATNVILEKNLLHDNRVPNIYDTYSSGVKAGEQTAGATYKGSTGNIIRYNKIYNITRPSARTTDISLGIYGARTNDALIHHNLVYNIGIGFKQTALNKIDVSGSYRMKFYNNTISADSNCFLTSSSGSNIRTYVKNNIFITKGTQNALMALEDTRIGKNVFVNRGGVYEGTTTRTSVAVWQKYNDVDSSSTSYYGIDSTALFPGGGNYEITTTSYTGEDLDLLYDIEGNAVDSSNPDCGAYEYDGSYLWLLLGLKRRKKHA